jgi:hypothetical protein
MSNAFDDYNFVLPPSEDKQQEFTVLDAGEYPFTVVKCEPGFYEPKANSKAPACKCVSVQIMIEHQGAKSFISKDFLLYSDLVWLIRSFFICIGMGTHGGEVTVNWDRAKGRRGRVKIKKVEGKQQGVFFNNIDKFLDPPATNQAPPPPSIQQPVEQAEEEEIPFDF